MFSEEFGGRFPISEEFLWAAPTSKSISEDNCKNTTLRRGINEAFETDTNLISED